MNTRATYVRCLTLTASARERRESSIRIMVVMIGPLGLEGLAVVPDLVRDVSDILEQMVGFHAGRRTFSSMHDEGL